MSMLSLTMVDAVLDACSIASPRLVLQVLENKSRVQRRAGSPQGTQHFCHGGTFIVC